MYISFILIKKGCFFIVTAFLAWAKTITSKWNEITGVAVGAFGTYYFVNAGTENIYTFTKYYYREEGPGFFDSNGTYYGNYKIKKTHRTTKSAGGTGGQLSTFYKNSTIIEPWF
ncbi:hypothetical protein [Neobacillus niacini]|uniref:hypothetical protein n=1 Tax=Neobacillus niacini TaxID=86668 RepID=UPI001C8E7CA1|nr:hypothetical protein [Neobacillus niacini]MBY0147734.1 hypothetical protein [Neobacillus niacini]